jgi:hypothetical protein
MKEEKIKEAVLLAQKTGHIFLATANTNGMPHVTAAGKLEAAYGGHVTVTEWFCPGTIANLRNNKHVSIIVWDKETDTGYQLLGRWDKINDMEILDGFAPELELEPPLPQIEKQLLIKIEKILAFKVAPHSDLED